MPTYQCPYCENKIGLAYDFPRPKWCYSCFQTMNGNLLNKSNPIEKMVYDYLQQEELESQLKTHEQN